MPTYARRNFGCAGEASSEYCTDLQEASLDGAKLQGAHLAFAQLQGASLQQTDLRATDLSFANLRGASLSGTQLQGAVLRYAGLQSADLEHVFVWRANPQQAKTEGTRVSNPETRPKYQTRDCPTNEDQIPCDWTAASFAALDQVIEPVRLESLRHDFFKYIWTLILQRRSTGRVRFGPIWRCYRPPPISTRKGAL